MLFRENGTIRNCEGAYIGVRACWNGRAGKVWVPDCYNWRIVRERFLIHPGGETDAPLEERYGTAVPFFLQWKVR